MTDHDGQTDFQNFTGYERIKSFLHRPVDASGLQGQPGHAAGVDDRGSDQSGGADG